MKKTLLQISPANPKNDDLIHALIQEQRDDNMKEFEMVHLFYYSYICDSQVAVEAIKKFASEKKINIITEKNLTEEEYEKFF